MLLSDRITGGFVALLGAAAFYGGSRLPPVPGQPVGPAAFPMVIGGVLFLCGILIALHVGRSFEEEAEADVQASEVAKEIPHEEPPPTRLWLVGLPPALLIFYVLVVERIGFVPTAFTMILLLGLALGARWRLILPVAALGPLFVHLAFYKLLRVPLPDGLLPMPW